MTVTLPAGTVRSTPLSTSWSPKNLCTPRISIIAASPSSSSPALREVPLHVVLEDRQDRGEDHVPDGGDHQQRHHPPGPAVDDLHLVEQLADGQHVHHRS